MRIMLIRMIKMTLMSNNRIMIMRTNFNNSRIDNTDMNKDYRNNMNNIVGDNFP